MAGPTEVSDVVLRPALEWLLDYVRAARQREPGFRYPSRLRQFLGKSPLTAADLRAVRRLVESDALFLASAAASLPPDAESVTRLWIARPDGWEADLRGLSDEHDRVRAEAEATTEAGRERRRREAAEARAMAAEQARDAALTRAAELEHALSEAAANAAESAERLDVMRSELIEARNDLRHEQDRLRAAEQRLARAEGDRDVATTVAEEAERMRDDVLVERSQLLAESGDLREVVEQARRLAERIGELMPASTTAVRQPMPIPGGLAGDPVAIARHLMSTHASVIIDGYNVAKRWRPDADLRSQRELLMAAVEVVAARFGTDLVVVFDGDEVVGAHSRSRSSIRVIWSAKGTTADDVIRDEVGRLPTSRPVVVVTDDREIVRDIRAVGAHHISSPAFIGVLEL